MIIKTHKRVNISFKNWVKDKQIHSFCLFQFGMTTLSEVDAILLSNHNTMLALPYVTEYSGFKGTVYCTEPTQQIGRYV